MSNGGIIQINKGHKNKNKNSFHALTYLSFNWVSKGTNDDDLGQIKYEHVKCDNLNMYSGIKFKTWWCF